jgi:aminoglycoside phosphotransferase (APT) family kinase protein
MSLDTARLEQWLHANVPGYAGPLAIEPFAGGQSNPTFRLSARSGTYVLRRKPMGQLLPGAHAVDREFRVQRALARSPVPVARVHALCEDDGVIGSAFYVMDYVDGRVPFDPRLPEMHADERRAVYASMNETIAALHMLDPAAAGRGSMISGGREIMWRDRSRAGPSSIARPKRQRSRPWTI